MWIDTIATILTKKNKKRYVFFSYFENSEFKKSKYNIYTCRSKYNDDDDDKKTTGQTDKYTQNANLNNDNNNNKKGR